MDINNNELNYLLTVSEVAQLLRTSNKAIYTMNERGHLPGCTRIRNRVLFKRDDLLEFIDGCVLSSDWSDDNERSN